MRYEISSIVMPELLATPDESLIDWSGLTLTLTYQDPDDISSPPPSPSHYQPASCGATVVNFSIAEEATSSQLAADWLLCVGAEQVVLRVIVLLSSQDLWSDWSVDETSDLVVFWDSWERADPELDLAACWQCCMTEQNGMQAAEERREERGERRVWRRLLSELTSV